MIIDTDKKPETPWEAQELIKKLVEKWFPGEYASLVSEAIDVCVEMDYPEPGEDWDTY